MRGYGYFAGRWATPVSGCGACDLGRPHLHPENEHPSPEAMIAAADAVAKELNQDHRDLYTRHLATMIREMVAFECSLATTAERERCAKIADAVAADANAMQSVVCEEIARRIRRGE